MLCPLCNVELKIAERQSIEIDYCPKCRGIWLDRGELDKLIERAAAAEAAPVQEYRENRGHHDQPDHDTRRYQGQNEHHQEHDRRPGHYRQKKKSFLTELFDFD